MASVFDSLQTSSLIAGQNALLEISNATLQLRFVNRYIKLGIIGIDSTSETITLDNVLDGCNVQGEQ